MRHKMGLLFIQDLGFRQKIISRHSGLRRNDEKGYGTCLQYGEHVGEISENSGSSGDTLLFLKNLLQ